MPQASKSSNEQAEATENLLDNEEMVWHMISVRLSDSIYLNLFLLPLNASFQSYSMQYLVFIEITLFMLSVSDKKCGITHQLFKYIAICNVPYEYQ